MEFIELTRNSLALVDDEDFDYLLSIGNWSASGTDPLLYASHYRIIGQYRVCILMHRVIMERVLGDLIPEGLVVDHINQNTLDNRRHNLRLATKSQNGFNSGMRKNNTSGHKGVDLHKNRNQYRARLGSNHLGWFDNLEDAIEARNKAEKELI